MGPSSGSPISGSMQVEELLERYPMATGLLLQHGVPCLVCGEPVWGTLGEVLGSHGKKPEEAAAIVQELKKELEVKPL
ncbi:MAG: DUF1858 domain-containing protein [Ignavibacteriae bacterium]|nr:DUF1858 domain-containing protein [Ignavibacteriota bacterium]